MKYPVLLLSVLPGLALGQTPPIKPNMTPVPTPAPVSLPGPASDVVGKPIRAEDAARIALREQPNILVARAQLLAAQGRSQEARAALYPTASISADYSRFQNIHNSGSGSSGFNSSLTVRQLVFDFGHTLDLVRQATSQEAVARHNLTATQADLVLQVKDAFYGYAQDQQLVKVQEANVTNTQAQLVLAQARLSSGLGAPADVLQAATNLGSATQSLTQARQTALNSRIELALLMGIDPRTPIETATGDEPVPSSEDVDGLVATALSNRPEIRAAQTSLRASGYGLNAARTSNAPTVSLSASVGVRGPNDPFASTSGTLGIGLNWDIFDGGFSGGAIKSARANVMTAQADLKQATLTAVSDVSQSYVNLKSAEQREAVATTQVANAAELVRLAEGRFRAGVAIFLEVTNAQTALVQAQVNAINAHTAVQQARAQLQRAIGAGVNGLTFAPAPLASSKK